MEAFENHPKCSATLTLSSVEKDGHLRALSLNHSVGANKRAPIRKKHSVSVQKYTSRIKNSICFDSVWYRKKSAKGCQSKWFSKSQEGSSEKGLGFNKDNVAHKTCWLPWWGSILVVEFRFSCLKLAAAAKKVTQLWNCGWLLPVHQCSFAKVPSRNNSSLFHVALQLWRELGSSAQLAC